MKRWKIIEFDNGIEHRNSPIIKKTVHKDGGITFLKMANCIIKIPIIINRSKNQ